MSRTRVRRKVLDPLEAERVLLHLGMTRNELNILMASLPIRGPEDLAAEAVTAAIEIFAELLTGCRERFC